MKITINEITPKLTGEINQGPYCRSCFKVQTGMLKF